MAEDLQILEFFKKYGESQSAHQIAENLAKRIDHSEESIRDRIRRVLSKLRIVDHKLLADENKVGREVTRCGRTTSPTSRRST